MTRHPLRLVAATVLLLAAQAGCGVLDSDEGGGGGGSDGWEDEAAAIEGIVNYRAERPELLEQAHTEEPVAYEVLPPVGGHHHPAWQDCNGEVYTQPVANENAVHSLEHGAVWITYRPDLPADQVSALADRVNGTEKLFMSPYPDLDSPISLQAWGYQLRVDDAGDERVDEFIRALRVNASMEGPAVRCDGGIPNTAPAAAPAAGGPCTWEEAPADGSTVDVGVPPPDEPREGTQLMTVAANRGDIVVEMDLAAVPCTAASFTHLAGNEVFDGSKCHRMFPGRGGPTYRFADENLPVGQSPPYPAGTVAMANSGPIGHDGAYDPSPGGGHPNQDVVIESLRVSDPA